MNMLIEKSNEHNFEVHLAFIDFHKAFDTIETWAILKALDAAWVDYRIQVLMTNKKNI